ncbi:tetratricopeptide repeat protein [Nostoc sp. DedQUE09]|uniref:tetratricopeptide repeat protein n=1 Tax=Nostoc sp. DedQUE09 TaxID=3075394 RepID=UPI002AD47B96|nr:tetratricopeptide repeat protein [Nostoc sp. DedQUE09]MDZ7955316.1 tetratricopeptide repeat protein [Nostoc sp. DedQUE09]
MREPQKAIEFYYQAVKAYKLVKPSKFGKKTSLELYTPEDAAKLAVFNLRDIAEIYRNLKQPQKAIQAYNQALEIDIQNKDHELINSLYYGIARIHEVIAEDNLKQKNFHKAIEAYNHAASIYQKAGKNYQSSVVNTLHKIADIQVKLKLPQSVLATYNRIIELQKKQKDIIGQVETIRQIGN